MQCELLEAAHLLLFNVVHNGGDTSGLKPFRRKLADSKRRISHIQFAALSEMADGVARLEKLKAENDAGYDDEVDEVLCDAMDAQEDRLFAHIDSLVLRQWAT
jgi:hypothetical protein